MSWVANIRERRQEAALRDAWRKDLLADIDQNCRATFDQSVAQLCSGSPAFSDSFKLFTKANEVLCYRHMNLPDWLDKNFYGNVRYKEFREQFDQWILDNRQSLDIISLRHREAIYRIPRLRFCARDYYTQLTKEILDPSPRQKRASRIARETLEQAMNANESTIAMQEINRFERSIKASVNAFDIKGWYQAHFCTWMDAHMERFQAFFQQEQLDESQSSEVLKAIQYIVGEAFGVPYQRPEDYPMGDFLSLEDKLGRDKMDRFRKMLIDTIYKEEQLLDKWQKQQRGRG